MMSHISIVFNDSQNLHESLDFAGEEEQDLQPEDMSPGKKDHFRLISFKEWYREGTLKTVQETLCKRPLYV